MKRLALITLIIGTALAIVPVASSMVLSDSGGSGGAAVAPGSVDPATQAVLLRSEALATQYTDPATLALILRSKGFSDYYSANGVTFHTDILGGNGGSSATPIGTSGNSFDWNTLLAVTLAGMLLLALAATTVTRRRHRLSF